MRIPRLLTLAASLLVLASCEVGVSAGYNLPRTNACRDAQTLPGKPIDPACLDAIGGP